MIEGVATGLNSVAVKIEDVVKRKHIALQANDNLKRVFNERNCVEPELFIRGSSFIGWFNGSDFDR